MADVQDRSPRFPVRLTIAQRKVVAKIDPIFTERLRLDEPDQRVITFTLEELNAIRQGAGRAVHQAGSGMERNSLRFVRDLTREAMRRSQGIGLIPPRERLYQFKITLKDIRPPIWRRIQVRDSTLDKFHERIQTAMGWTNSHLHHFQVGDILYGDPVLMGEGFQEMNYRNSLTTNLSAIVPRSGERFRFEYEYDFGDCWLHDVLFEGCLRAEPGLRYPLCLEGERNCPPEDVGGIQGYQEFLEVIADPNDEEHEQYLGWIGGSFRPEAFDPESATRRMRRGLPNWRKSR
jgi:Plasmid pRiA4b ORF-3-like protein